MREADGWYMELRVRCNFLTVTDTASITAILEKAAEERTKDAARFGWVLLNEREDTVHWSSMDVGTYCTSVTQCRNNNEQLTLLRFPSFLEFLPTVPPLRQQQRRNSQWSWTPFKSQRTLKLVRRRIQKKSLIFHFLSTGLLSATVITK